MDKRAATKLATRLMHQHGVGHLMFEFDRAKRSSGRTFFLMDRPVKITLSGYWTERMSESEVVDTLLHEIAHAKAGISAGHGPAWRSVARQIGARPERCAKTNMVPDYLWKGTCPNGHTFGLHRAPARVRSCNQCRPVFSVNHLFEWSKGGQKIDHLSVSPKYAAEYLRVSQKYSV